MTITQTFSTRYLLATQYALSHTEEMAQHGVFAIFRARRSALSHTILTNLERKDRVVLLLLDGRRTLRDIARLTSRHEVDIAYSLVHLLTRGYIEFINSTKEPYFPSGVAQKRLNL